jgi:imidazolonepropionase-like amidohydrolase
MKRTLATASSLVFLLGGGVALTPAGEAESRAFVGATILTAAGDEYEDGVMLVRGGKIAAVGPRSETAVPPDAEVRDLTGLVVVPGLVDTHSHIGGGAGGDGSEPIQPEVRILDSIDVRDPGFHRARAGGITTVNVMPGSGHLISGQTVYLKLREGETIDDLLIAGADGEPAGGLKMANGTNSRRAPPFPGTRAKSAALVREAFVAADEYRQQLARAGDEQDVGQERNLRLEALAEALDGRRVVHHHTHRHDDILTVLRLKEEFGFRVVLHHVSDAWKVADRLAADDIPCSLILVDSPGGKLEARDIALENGAALERAGVPVAFHTDDWITDSRLFLRMAALGVRAGMSREGALRALTINPARMLDLGEETGSLEPGKDADFVVLSGDPFSVYTRVLETWVEGRKVFDRDRPEDALSASGGWGAGDPRTAHIACFGEEDHR